HPLAQRFASAVESLSVALAPESTRLYHGTARNFLTYLGADHPEVVSLDQLRRDPHILDWMAKLRSRVPSLAPGTYISRLIFLRPILAQLPPTAHPPHPPPPSAPTTAPPPLHACPATSPRNRINSPTKNYCAATIWALTSCCCTGTPACVLARRPTSPSFASTPPAPINGRFMYRSAS